MSKSTNFLLVSHLESSKKRACNKSFFNKVFKNHLFTKSLEHFHLEYRNRIFTPLTTVWTFLTQTLSEDHSCRNAVCSLIASTSFTNSKQISTATGAYCRARKKLPEEFFSFLTKQIAKLLDSKQENQTWKDFNVKLVDGSDLSIPDTKENRKDFQKATNSTGLLKCRIVGIFSLAHGALTDLRIGPFFGKGTGEVSLFRKMFNSISKGDLLLMDRLFCNFFDMAHLLKKEIHFVVRKNACMKSNFKKGHHLGKNDHIITLNRPWNRSDSINHGKLLKLPRKIQVREMRIKAKRKGFRTKELYLIRS